MIPMTQTSRLLLVLMEQTGGFLIPEHHSYWRGANGARLAIGNVLVRGRAPLTQLARHELIVRASLRSVEMPLVPDWMSRARSCWGITERGRTEATLIRAALGPLPTPSSDATMSEK